jgi:hypothetical protein
MYDRQQQQDLQYAGGSRQQQQDLQYVSGSRTFQYGDQVQCCSSCIVVFVAAAFSISPLRSAPAPLATLFAYALFVTRRHSGSNCEDCPSSHAKVKYGTSFPKRKCVRYLSLCGYSTTPVYSVLIVVGARVRGLG